ncbi:MAG: hypothetical protein AAF594_14545 [Bacteroidota bacterium]
MRAALLLTALVVTAAGCDIFGSDVLTYDGVEVEVRGDATLAVEDGRLVVSGLDGARSGGFTIPGELDRVDVETAPVAIPDGGRFGIEVESDDGEELASIYNEGTGNGEFDLRVTFADALGVSAVTVRYYLGGERGDLVLEIPSLALTGNRLARRAETGAGSGSGDPESVHVRRVGGRYVVVSDSDGPDGARQSCAGFTIVPPGAFAGEFPEGLCTDWIEVEPLGISDMPEGRVAVTARGVGSFTVQDLSLDRVR